MKKQFLLIGFQDPASPVMEGIIDVHNYIFFYLTIVLLFVLYILSFIVYSFYFQVNHDTADISNIVNYRNDILKTNKVVHGTIIEIVWTAIPGVILMLIAVPSFALLYSMDEVILPAIILKVIGHQWYWSYEYSDFGHKSFENEIVNIDGSDRIKFDSYMITETDLNKGDLRLLEVDNSIVLPTNTHVKVLVTASDVLHSWAVPSLGIKVDAVPGRLSQTNLFINREGTFYGQCSEICGVNHGFMPISIIAVDLNSFLGWASQKQ